jgi:hypothetical protein
VVEKFFRVMKVHSAEIRRKDGYANVIFKVGGVSNVKEWLQNTFYIEL